MKVIGIIPARYASSRFPGKPLVEIDGLPMIQRVYEQAFKAKELAGVVIATDDHRIFDCVKAFGGEVIMTDAEHPTGTDRIAEVAAQLSDADVIVNIQGDEPLIDPQQIDQLASLLKVKNDFSIATMAFPIHNPAEVFDPNVVKVVFDQQRRALYFSRSTLPYCRNVEAQKWLEAATIYKHIGMYAYRRSVLLEIAQLPVGRLEQVESLEQLRWLERGYAIGIAITKKETISIDCPEDLLKLNIQLKENQ